MELQKTEKKTFDEDLKTSKTFMVAYTKHYKPSYGTEDVSAALIIPEDYFKVETPITDVYLYEIDGEDDAVLLEVYTKRGLSFEEAIELYKKFSDTEFNQFLWDSYMEWASVKDVKWADWSTWETLYKFQDEFNEIPKKEN